IRDREICGNSFGIVVDDDSLVTHLLYCPYGVYCSVVKLHTLADTDWPGTEYDYLLAVRRDAFVLFFIRSVKVRCSTFELSGTGIDHFIHRHNTVVLSEIEYSLLVRFPKMGDM